jgi:hypothetical protein
MSLARATGMAPRSSMTGTMEIKKVIRYFIAFLTFAVVLPIIPQCLGKSKKGYPPFYGYQETQEK